MLPTLLADGKTSPVKSALRTPMRADNRGSTIPSPGVNDKQINLHEDEDLKRKRGRLLFTDEEIVYSYSNFFIEQMISAPLLSLQAHLSK